MGIPGAANPLLLRRAAAVADDSYQIEKSLRFNDDDSPFLTRESLSEGNRRTWTYSAWVKRGEIDDAAMILSSGTDSPNQRGYIGFDGSDRLAIWEDSGGYELVTQAVYRDPSAWMHIVVAFDSTQNTSTERVKLYVNGKQDTAWDGTYNNFPTQNFESIINSPGGNGIRISGLSYASAIYKHDGLLAEPLLIDGLALSSAAFGKFTSSGSWEPVKFNLPTPNDGTTWSSKVYTSNATYNGSATGTTFQTNKAGDKAFDITDSTEAAVDESSPYKSWIYFRPASPFTGVTTLRIHTGYVENFKLNGVTVNPGVNPAPANSANQWYNIDPKYIPTSLTEIAVQGHSASGGSNARISAIEINGVQLEDGKTDKSWDAFKAINTGKIWSNETVGSYSTGLGLDKAFKGKVIIQGGEGGDMTMMPANDAWAGWKPATDVVASTSIRVYFQRFGSLSGITTWCKLNNVDITTSITDTLDSLEHGWITLPTTSGAHKVDSTNGLQVYRRSSDGHTIRIHAIEVDGVILTDGNINNFHLKFNDTSLNRYLGKDTLNGKIADATGGLPIYKTSDDYGDVKDGTAIRTDSNKANLVFAVSGDSIADISNHADLRNSGSAKTITNSNAVVTSDQSRFYGSSISLGAYNENKSFYVTPANGGTDFDFGTSSFCFECWARSNSTSHNSASISPIFETSYDDTGLTGWIMLSYTSNTLRFYYVNAAGNAVQVVDSSTSLNNNDVGAWVHHAVTHDSSTNKLKVFRNGVCWVEKSSGDFKADWTSTSGLYVGNQNFSGDADRYFKGEISDFRVYKGAAVYTANFKPPIRNDFAVYNLTSATGSATVAWDGAKTVTATNGATTTTSNTKFYGTSKDLDGSDDYINTETSTDWNFPGEFTVELWFKPEATTGIRPLIAGRDNNSGWCFSYWAGNDGKLTFYTGEGTSPSNNGTEVQWEPPSLYTNTWVHVAVTRNSSNSVTIWVNGDDKISTTVTGTLTVESDDPITIGNVWPSGMTQYDGQFGDIRVYKGVCKYVADFTVPDGSTSVASATGGLPIRNTSGTNGETALGGFRADYIPGTTTDVSSYLVLAIPGNSYEDVSASIRKPGPEELDSLTDSPTNYAPETGDDKDGGVTRGNFCTLNPLSISSGWTLSEGNLKAVSSSSYGALKSTIGMTSGKWYCEMTPESTNSATACGIARWDHGNTWPGHTSGDIGFAYLQDGRKATATDSRGTYGATWQAGDVIGIAVDLSGATGSVTFYKNGASQGQAFTFTTADGPWFMTAFDDSSTGHTTQTWNFGQREFKYTNAGSDRPASDYKCLCTQNLDNTFDGEDSENNPSKYFDIKLWTGTGADLDIKGLGFQPDLVWIKPRSATNDHVLVDAARGVTKRIFSNLNNAESAAAESLKTFNSDGFTLGDHTSVNTSDVTHVAWNWDAGTSAATASTDGSITPTAQWVNTTAGFSISAYTGTGSAGTIGHGLGAKPELIMIKSRDDQSSNQSWTVHHKDVAATNNLILNDTAAAGATGSWNNTAPTDSVFSVGTVEVVNTNNKNYIAYCWTSKEGYSAFGSYTASSDLPFIYTGFKIAFLMIKNVSSGSTNWRIMDSERDPFNDGAGAKWIKVTSAVEVDERAVDILSNGFKLRMTDGGDLNYSTDTFIYCAFASLPFKTARAR